MCRFDGYLVWILQDNFFERFWINVWATSQLTLAAYIACGERILDEIQGYQFVPAECMYS